MLFGNLAPVGLTPFAPPLPAAGALTRKGRKARTFRSRGAAAPSELAAPVVVTCPAARTGTHILSEELFRGVLRRERHRAARFETHLLLVLVSAKSPASVTASEWRTLMTGLRASIRDTDIVGWAERGNVLGILLPDFDSLPASQRASVEKRLRKALEPAGESLTVAVHHPAPLTSTDAAAHSAVDPLLLKLCARGRQTVRHEIIKRALDVAGSLALLLVLAPLLLVVAAMIKCTSRGSILFRQERVGRWARPFTMWKFRTMTAGADPSLHRKFVSAFIRQEEKRTEAAPVFKLTDDPRVTRLGRFLRRTSIDELPQLFNVLLGHMSLVGPRPPLPYELEQYQPWHRRRVLEAKPGVTGLWQIAGRSRTTFDGMVRLDLRYVRTRSLWTDIKILLATPAAVISGKGAW